jgi:phosphatidylserine/phosphatidylglycerophosphate/cardiolipin synthase-like enzyme
MERIIKHTDTFNSGAFILNDDRMPYEPFIKCTSIFLTQEGNFKLKQEILKLINESQEVIKICSFIITDKEIYEAILNKAKFSSTVIFILTQLDQSKLKNTSQLNDFITEEEIREKPSQAHLNYIKNLYEQGVHVRASTSAHAKFIIVDRTIGFLTSANLTSSSLTLNTESGIYLTGNDARELDKLFDVIFQKGTRYRQYISANKKKTFVVQAETNVDKSYLPNQSNSKIRYTYENESHDLYEEIIDIIKLASEFLFISTYSIVGLNNLDEFVIEIKDAIKRGVSINIFCRGMNYRNDHIIGADRLNSLGCKIFADIYNHSKCVISEKTGIIFTANIDGNHGLKNGFEVGLILNEEQRLDLLEIQKYLIDTCIYKYEAHPSRIQFFQTYIVYEMTKKLKPTIFPNDLTISIKKGFKVNEKELLEQPIYFAKSKDCNFLIVGSSFYKCDYHDGAFQIFERDIFRFDIERYIIKYFNLKIIFN